MKYLKKVAKTILIISLFFILLSIILTALNYFNVISYQTLAVFKIIIPILSLGLSGFLMGKKSVKNGWLEGIKIGLIVTILLAIITAIIGEFAVKKITFFVILLCASTFGSIIGINTKNT